MKTRKIALLSACGILLVIFILQTISGHKDTAKSFTFSDEPDTISFETPDGNFDLVKQNDNWFVGEKKYPANNQSVENLIEDLKEIKALDKVGTASSEDSLEKYDLIQTKKITCTVKSGSKELLSVQAGKASSTGSQSYATINGKSDIYLISTNLNSTLNKKLSDFRSKSVWALEGSAVGSITITGKKDLTLSRSGQNDSIVWTLSENGTAFDADSEKATTWFNSAATLSCSKWLEDDEKIPGTLSAKITVQSVGKSVTLDLYEVSGSDEKVTYYGKSSESPYAFELASYEASKFTKTAKDLTK